MIHHLLRVVCVILFFNYSLTEQVELFPKLVRWPTHLDHYLCKQLHTGIGTRSHAVTNLNGELCRTYCRIIDRMNGKITYTENVTPNFVRCGPNQARCVDGVCVGLNFPSVLGTPPPSPPSTEESSSNEPPVEASEVYNSDSNSTDNDALALKINSSNSLTSLSSNTTKEMVQSRN